MKLHFLQAKVSVMIVCVLLGFAVALGFFEFNGHGVVPAESLSKGAFAMAAVLTTLSGFLLLVFNNLLNLGQERHDTWVRPNSSRVFRQVTYFDRLDRVGVSFYFI